jgi:hypothetical protein
LTPVYIVCVAPFSKKVWEIDNSNLGILDYFRAIAKWHKRYHICYWPLNCNIESLYSMTYQRTRVFWVSSQRRYKPVSNCDILGVNTPIALTPYRFFVDPNTIRVLTFIHSTKNTKYLQTGIIAQKYINPYITQRRRYKTVSILYPLWYRLFQNGKTARIVFGSTKNWYGVRAVGVNAHKLWWIDTFLYRRWLDTQKTPIRYIRYFSCYCEMTRKISHLLLTAEL